MPYSYPSLCFSPHYILIARGCMFGPTAQRFSRPDSKPIGKFTGKKSVESFRNHCVIEQKITQNHTLLLIFV